MQKERNEQIAFITWLRMKYPEAITIISPIVKYGGTLKQRLIQGHIQKRMGYIAGTPDIFIPCARGGFNGLFIELKAKGGYLSEDQASMAKRLNKHGFCAICCHGFEEAIEKAEKYMKGSL
jgi:hypothetical protein